MPPRNTSLKPAGHLAPFTRHVSSSGDYLYDGSGNIKSIGSDSFAYDVDGRLMQAAVQGNQQSYNYDAFGNRLSATRAANAAGCVGGCEAAVTVRAQNNHLVEQTYDDAGNVETGFGASYTYDGTGMVTRATVGTDDRIFLYTAGDERIAVRNGTSWTWTARDQGNKVLREFTSSETSSSPLVLTAHTWTKDYIWRDGLLLASVSQGSSGLTTYHYHLDHLGTPRMITNDAGILVAKHTYYPFGAEIDITPHESAVEAMKFTGHERDTVAGNNASVDYMHARLYNANLGRFLAVDPDLDSEKCQTEPQCWNRYAYVENNPLKATDPNGRDTYLVNRYINTSILTTRLNLVSHTFIMTKSGNSIHTYSWGNAANKATVGRLFKDTPEDLAAAAKAYSTSETLRLVYASREGDASLDPYIEKVFQEHAHRADDRSNHANYGVCQNCKTEASKIIDEAKRLKAADDEKKKPDPKNVTVKVSPADHQAQTPASH